MQRQRTDPVTVKIGILVAVVYLVLLCGGMALVGLVGNAPG